MSKYFKAKVINNLSVNNKTNLLTIEPLEPVINPKPGQFYMVEVSDSYDPLLKRPFSLFREISEGIQFLYTIKGKGTILIKDFKPGKIINLLGPLGNGYPEHRSSHTPLLIAGGIGIASIFSLAEALAKKAYILYGAKSKDELLMVDELKSLGIELIISTDDGSMGERGTVVDVLNDFLNRHSSLISHLSLYACGPQPMLEAVSGIAIDNSIEGYVSLEENMACGVGACLGCALKIKVQSSSRQGRDKVQSYKRKNSPLVYKRACREGPVFPIWEIVW